MPESIIVQTCWRCGKEYSYGTTQGEFHSASKSDCPHCTGDPCESELITARIRVLNESLKVIPGACTWTFGPGDKRNKERIEHIIDEIARLSGKGHEPGDLGGDLKSKSA